MEIWHLNILQTPLSSKLLPSSSQPRKPRHRKARLAEAQSPHHGPPRSQTPRISLTSMLRTTLHHSRSSLPDFQTREAPLASLSGMWEKRQSRVVSEEVSVSMERDQDPRRAHSLSTAPKRACCSKSTSPRGLGHKTLAWFAIPSWGANSGFSVVLHHQGKVLVTCSIQSRGTSGWFGSAAP